MFYEPRKDRKQLLDEMLVKGVTLEDLETLKRGEEVYLWERDVATLRELSEFTEKNFWKIYRVFNKKDFLFVTHEQNEPFASRKRLLGGMKYPIHHVVPIGGYAKFVEWRESRLDFVIKQTGIDIFGRYALEKMIRNREITVASIDIKGKKVTGISKKSMEEQINKEIDRLRRCLDGFSNHKMHC